MYEFTRREGELEPQASGDRFGPPHKHIATGFLDSPQFPSIRPKCFGCFQPLMIAEIRGHILNCDKVSFQDLARFKSAMVEFQANPRRAREVAEEFLNRVRLNYGIVM